MVSLYSHCYVYYRRLDLKEQPWFEIVDLTQPGTTFDDFKADVVAKLQHTTDGEAEPVVEARVPVKATPSVVEARVPVKATPSVVEARVPVKATPSVVEATVPVKDTTPVDGPSLAESQLKNGEGTSSVHVTTTENHGMLHIYTKTYVCVCVLTFVML